MISLRNLAADNGRVLVFFTVLILVALVATGAFAQVQFERIDSLGNSFLTWVRGTPLTILFTIAFIILGTLAAFNRISWLWVIMVCVGAFFAFGGPNLANQLRSIFG